MMPMGGDVQSPCSCLVPSEVTSARACPVCTLPVSLTFSRDVMAQLPGGSFSLSQLTPDVVGSRQWDPHLAAARGSFNPESPCSPVLSAATAWCFSCIGMELP